MTQKVAKDVDESQKVRHSKRLWVRKWLWTPRSRLRPIQFRLKPRQQFLRSEKTATSIWSRVFHVYCGCDWRIPSVVCDEAEVDGQLGPTRPLCEFNLRITFEPRQTTSRIQKLLDVLCRELSHLVNLCSWCIKNQFHRLDNQRLGFKK